MRGILAQKSPWLHASLVRTTIVAVCLLSYFGAGIANAAKDDLPNVIFLLADDQGWGDVAYNGHPKIKTPNLDAMARAGIRFDRFYAGASVCSPTRVTCLTGRNNWRVNINGPVRPDEAHLPVEEITLAEAIQPKGYVSGHFGKWHVGGLSKERAGAHYMTPAMAGFNQWFSTRNVIRTYDPYARLPKGGLIDLYYDNGRLIPIEEAQRDPTMRGDDATIVMNKAIDFIREQAEAETPFMAVIWFHHVHTPLGRNPELMALYADCEPQEQVYFANITAIDREVGRLRHELRTLGVAMNTMLWYASDNGPNLKGKKNVKQAASQGGKFNYTPVGSSGAFRGWKRHLHEGGVIVPGILEWPARIAKPFATKHAAVTSDYFPTVLDVLDVSLPPDREYDGLSLLPLIEGKSSARDKPIGFHANGWDAWTEQRYKIVRSSEKVGSGQWELYDLSNDPFEQRDLATNQPEQLEAMIEDYEAWAGSVEADVRRMLQKNYAKKPRPTREANRRKAGSN